MITHASGGDHDREYGGEMCPNRANGYLGNLECVPLGIPFRRENSQDRLTMLFPLPRGRWRGSLSMRPGPPSIPPWSGGKEEW
jgi:hypothetical protein